MTQKSSWVKLDFFRMEKILRNTPIHKLCIKVRLYIKTKRRLLDCADIVTKNKHEDEIWMLRMCYRYLEFSLIIYICEDPLDLDFLLNPKFIINSSSTSLCVYFEYTLIILIKFFFKLLLFIPWRHWRPDLMSIFTELSMTSRSFK